MWNSGSDQTDEAPNYGSKLDNTIFYNFGLLKEPIIENWDNI